jgi:hypothetical protein
MTFLANIDPSLRDMSLADVNPTASNLATSGAAPDGNSIPGGEPVHRSPSLCSPNIQVVTSFSAPTPDRLPLANQGQTDLRVN